MENKLDIKDRRNQEKGEETVRMLEKNLIQNRPWAKWLIDPPIKHFMTKEEVETRRLEYWDMIFGGPNQNTGETLKPEPAKPEKKNLGLIFTSY